MGESNLPFTWLNTKMKICQQLNTKNVNSLWVIKYMITDDCNSVSGRLPLYIQTHRFNHHRMQFASLIDSIQRTEKVIIQHDSHCKCEIIKRPSSIHFFKCFISMKVEQL